MTSQTVKPSPSADRTALRKACKARGIKQRSKLSNDQMRAAIEAWETARSDKEIADAQDYWLTLR
jgi:hypothetical protein